MTILVKDVMGYEGKYLIDSLGNVVSLPKVQGRYLHNKYKILATKRNKFGYVEVTLCSDGKMRTYLLHRLLALHFIPNPEGLPEVNHINGIKHDNRLSNLEWVSVAQNTKHAYDNNLGGFRDRALDNLKKINSKTSYVGITLSKDDNVLTFKTTREAANAIGSTPDNISRAIRNHSRVRGYVAKGIKYTS